MFQLPGLTLKGLRESWHERDANEGTFLCLWEGLVGRAIGADGTRLMLVLLRYGVRVMLIVFYLKATK